MICDIKRTVGQIFIFSLFLFGINAESLPPQYSENEVKAIYILKFTRYTYWKENLKKDEKLTIGVYGKTVVSKYLKKFLLSNAEENKDLEIKIIKKVEDIKNCHVLYLSGLSNREVDGIVKKVEGNPILTISDNKKFLEKGIMINLFTKGRKVVYSIDKVSVDSVKIKLSPKIYSLAVKVKQ